MMAIWAYFYRLLGLVYLIAIGNLWPQIVPLIGSRGIAPVKHTLARIKQDIASPLHLFYFPTLFWAFSSDVELLGVVAVGILSSVTIVIGVFPHAFPSLPMLICYCVFLSWTNSRTEVIPYPWHTLLCEVGALAVLIHPTSPPSPYIAWMFRWLLFRLMFGFGKKKFAWGSGWQNHTLFIREFFVNSPSPNPNGELFHRHLPNWMFPGFLYGMFVGEMIVPFFFFAPQPYRAGAGVVTIGLMAGIQLAGNFGHFNILTAVMCLPLFDGAFHENEIHAPITSSAFIISNLYLLGGLLHLPLDSFTDLPVLQLLSVMGWLKKTYHAALRYPLMAWACIKAFKVCGAYGVFHTEQRPPVRQTCIFEGSNDGGKSWREFEYNQTTGFSFTAPFQPFLGYDMFYYGHGFPSCVHLYNLSQVFPFSQTRSTNLHRICDRLMDPASPVKTLFSSNPFPGNCPGLCRVRLIWKHFGSIDMSGMTEEASKEPEEKEIVTLIKPTKRSDRVWEQWHRNISPDSEIYEWFRAKTKAESCVPSLAEWRAFWSWIPQVKGNSWLDMPTIKREMDKQYSPSEIDVLEMVLGHVTAINEASFQKALPSNLTSFDMEYVIHYALLKGNAPADDWEQGQLTTAAIIGAYSRLLSELDDGPEKGIRQAMMLRSCFWYDAIVLSSSFQRLSQMRDGRSQYKVIPLVWKMINSKDDTKPSFIFFKCVAVLEDTARDWKLPLRMPTLQLVGSQWRATS